VKSKQSKGTKMNNKMKMIGMGLGMLAISIFCQQAHANALLIGSIGFNGSYTANGSGPGDLSGATEITGVTSTVATSPSPVGGFSGLGGDTASFNTPISLGATATPAGVELWKVDTGVDTYEFFSTGNGAAVSTTVGTTIVEQLAGMGFAEEFTDVGNLLVAGPSGGTWGITLNGSGSTQFLFTGTSTTVPDGGTTLMMLGGAFVAVGAIRRKISGK
jgi:hypothetical protein